MSVTYAVSKDAVTNTCNYRALDLGTGFFQYNQRRAFWPFDLTGSGLSAGDVELAELILVCTIIVGGGNDMILTSAIGANGFGALLEATNGDWASTVTNLEDTLLVNATGTYTFSVNPANLDYTGVNYFRLKNAADDGMDSEDAPYQTGASFSSANASSNKPILRLTLRSGQVIIINIF